MKAKCYKFIIAFSMLSVIVFTGESIALDKIKQFRDFMIDPPTLHCRGFRWYIYGDDDAVDAVKYRKVGDNTWSNVLPIFRINREVTNWDFHPYA